MAVSFLVIEFLKDQLFTKLTTQRFCWPRTILELSEQNKIEIVATNLEHIDRGIPALTRIIERIKATPESTVRLDDVLGKLRNVAAGKALLAHSYEIDWLQDVLQGDRFAILDEKYFMLQSSYYTATAWPYHRKFHQL